MAKIFRRVASLDNVVILGTREAAIEPFDAPNWIDLRIGMYLSLTGIPPNDDVPNGSYAETIPANHDPSNYCYIGLKDHNAQLPFTAPVNKGTFVGFSNNVGFFMNDNSILTQSDIGVGTSGDYWRAMSDIGSQWSFIVIADAGVLRSGQDGIQFHLVRNILSSNYAGAVGFRIIRDRPDSTTLTIQVPTDGLHSSDMQFTATPTLQHLLALLDPWPGNVQTIGPVTLPPIGFDFIDSLFAYWPFRNSRLRISAWGIGRGG